MSAAVRGGGAGESKDFVADSHVDVGEEEFVEDAAGVGGYVRVGAQEHAEQVTAADNAERLAVIARLQGLPSSGRCRDPLYGAHRRLTGHRSRTGGTGGPGAKAFRP